jgi:hypothetical protein
MSYLLKLLHEKLKKGVRFQWTETDDCLLMKIKKLLQTELELYIPDHRGSFTLETDASNKV